MPNVPNSAALAAAGYSTEQITAIQAQGQTWAVDGNGGVFAEANAQLNNAVWTSVNAWVGNGVPWGGADYPLAQDGEGCLGWDAIQEGSYTSQGRPPDPTLAAYFITENDAYDWMQSQVAAGNLSVSVGNKFQQGAQGLSDTANAIGNDFSSGNIGAGLEAVGGIALDTTLIGLASGAGNDLIEGGTGGGSTAEQQFLNTQQVAAQITQAVGQAGMGNVGAGESALSKLVSATQGPQVAGPVGGPPPPGAAHPVEILALALGSLALLGGLLYVVL
ncbi:MAG TPA: hypothetical protein VMB05_18365 [Solirubrobacteraceae bacterium]|nr:hypothetical protein [Solirubrobacteraceae bacterium]